MNIVKARGCRGFGYARAIRLAASCVAVGMGASQAQAQPLESSILSDDFESGSTGPWWTAGTQQARVQEGRLCVDVTAGTANPWDVLLGRSGIPLSNGGVYRLAFEASAEPEASFATAVQLGLPPYTAALQASLQVAAEPRNFVFDFVSGLDTTAAQLVFQLGGSTQDYTLCLDDISLSSDGAGYTPDTGPLVRVNQLGYVPHGPKRANLVTDLTTPAVWELLDASGSVVHAGETLPLGFDVPAGESLHSIDFSSFCDHGAGYTLRVGDDVSYPFSIEWGLYDGLRRDALAFFYPMRSGTPIEAEFAGAAYARDAGHLDVPPNQGDTDVPCVTGACDYSVDVRGGWYDAGDQGKYVVNGGISVWQLVNAWETAQSRRSRALTDGAQAIPERNNGVPDVLDEARWELEFLLRMQVEPGRAYAGMAFHRVHDESWTGIPTAPAADPMPRFVHAPSTAATLNLAATTAQCARVFRRFDRELSRRCLRAARTAWQAALANPSLFTPPPLGGGGEYGDADVSDEFYWAAAELYVTTGESTYRDFLRTSPHFQFGGLYPDGFGWASVSALGDLTLASLPNGLRRSELRGLHAELVAAADRVIELLSGQGYAVPFRPQSELYYWGSNSQVLNQIVLLASAYDVTGREKYREAAFEAMDYILGRNALNQSYVTGYGTKFSMNQHHRFWAYQADPAYPHPPAGALAGGPNSNLEDPLAAALLAGCAPQKCYIDDIQSYSTNEVAINWNSALFWVSAWLADHS